ncbi:MAG TPA: DNA repair protein RadA, partial [Thalassobaculum sp.]
MAKSSSRYVCQDCGAVQPKWAGKCEACGAWNTLIEEVVEAAAPKGLKPGGGRRLSFVELDGQTSDAPRRVTGIGEFDRVLG